MSTCCWSHAELDGWGPHGHPNRPVSTEASRNFPKQEWLKIAMASQMALLQAMLDLVVECSFLAVNERWSSF